MCICIFGDEKLRGTNLNKTCKTNTWIDPLTRQLESVVRNDVIIINNVMLVEFQLEETRNFPLLLYFRKEKVKFLN